MDYYEELGLERSATPEEIHGAYRNVTRLLHPDQQQDAELRRLAECQMRRLNSIYGVLSNPAGRRRYDAQLRGTFLPASKSTTARWTTAKGTQGAGWLFAAALGAGGMAWYLTADTPGTEPVVARLDHPPPVPPEKPTAESKRPRRPTERPYSGTESAAPRRTASRPNRIGAEAFTRPLGPDREPAPPGNAVSARSAIAAVESLQKFEGTWFYFAPVQHPDPALYRPEFIELVIRERDGVIHGRYRARYTVGDRAISPLVAFAFEGAVDDRAADLKWTGSGGARGEVRLQLLSSARLEIFWSAGELGSEMGLASGTAVLVRRQEK